MIFNCHLIFANKCYFGLHKARNRRETTKRDITKKNLCSVWLKREPLHVLDFVKSSGIITYCYAYKNIKNMQKIFLRGIAKSQDYEENVN